MSFTSDVPVRSNGQRITYDWFNAIRTAGVNLENFLGSGFIIETSVTIANNQSSVANVTGASFSSASYKSALLFSECRRKTDSTEAVALGFLFLIYRDATSTWDVIDYLNGDDDGITFSITAAGQLQYISDNMSGTNYSGTFKFRAMTWGA